MALLKHQGQKSLTEYSLTEIQHNSKIGPHKLQLIIFLTRALANNISPIIHLILKNGTFSGKKIKVWLSARSCLMQVQTSSH